MILKLHPYITAFMVLALITVLTACGSSSTGIKSPYKQVGGSGAEQTGLSKDAPIKDRMDNLEQRIDIIETDLRQLKPSIENLVAIESDIQDLVKELASLTSEKDSLQQQMNEGDNQQQLPNTSETMMASSAPTNLTTYNTTNTASQFSVSDIRVGIHSQNKVRLVMDFTSGDEINYDIKQQNGSVILTLPKTKWMARPSWNSSKTPLINSYNVDQNNGDSTLSITTRGDDLTVKVFVLGPVKAGAGSRLVIDFERGV